MLRMRSGLVVGMSMVRPVRLAFMFITSCTMRAMARNRRGAIRRSSVAQRLRHATSTVSKHRQYGAAIQLALDGQVTHMLAA